MLRAVATGPLTAAIGGRQPLTRVGVARQCPLADGVNTITAVSGNNSMNTRTSCYSPRDANVVDIVLGFPGFYSTASGQANFTTSYAVTAAIEYPAGTFTAVQFSGASSQTVTPGDVIYYSDPTPVYIPAGTQFWVKLYVTWTGGLVAFPLASFGVCGTSSEWMDYGVGLTDQTQTTTTFTPDLANPPFNQGTGFMPQVLARTSTRVPVVGMLGDSITQGSGDQTDPTWGATSWARGLRGVIPAVNVGRFAEQASNYLSNPRGRSSVLRDSITHLVFAYGRNDFDSSVSSATMLTRMQNTLNPYLARGVKCYVATVTPRTTSTDSWITEVNQTVHNAGFEAQRVAYNAAIRANWASYGLSGIFDFARVMDPTDSGKWIVTGYTGRFSYGAATLTGGAITAVSRPSYSAGTAYGGAAYPASQSAHPCNVYRYADDPIRTGDATITCATDGSGVVTSFSVVSGGSYTYAPVICPQGNYTNDGTHPTSLGYTAMFAGANFGPQAFSL